MKTNKRNVSFLSMWVLASVLIIASCSKDDVEYNQREMGNQVEIEERSGHADQNKLLAQLRAATAKYHRLDVAVDDMYVLDPHCVEVPGLGGMGFHALRGDLVDGEFNIFEPEALVYEPMKNGKVRLVAIEFIVRASDWDDSQGVPMFGNQPFDDHTYEGAPGPPFPHYQLHVWVWKNNPLGMYFPFNPNVNCDYAGNFVMN